jgi:hypothetical protein
LDGGAAKGDRAAVFYLDNKRHSGLLLLALVLILLYCWEGKGRNTASGRANKMLRASEKIFTIFFINTQPSNFLSIRIMAKKFFGWSGEQLRQMRIHQHPFTRTGQSGNGEGQGSGTYSLRVPPPAGQRSIQKCGGIQQQDRYSGETLLHSIIHDITATSPRTAGLKTSSGRPKRWNPWPGQPAA